MSTAHVLTIQIIKVYEELFASSQEWIVIKCEMTQQDWYCRIWLSVSSNVKRLTYTNSLWLFWWWRSLYPDSSKEKKKNQAFLVTFKEAGWNEKKFIDQWHILSWVESVGRSVFPSSRSESQLYRSLSSLRLRYDFSLRFIITREDRRWYSDQIAR